MLRAAGFGFFGGAAPSSGEGSDLCPLGDPHSPLLGFTFCQKITETSVSELRDQPPSSDRSGAFCPFASFPQSRNPCTGGCGDRRMLWHRTRQPGTVCVPGDLPGRGEPDWHNLWLQRASAWHRRPSWHDPRPQELGAVPNPGHGPQPPLTCQHRTNSPVPLTEGSHHQPHPPSSSLKDGRFWN